MEYDIGAEEQVSTAVVRAVSAVEGEDPDSLPPLTRVVDPDALNALFESRDGGLARTGGHLSLVYSNCRVTVDNGEYVTIQLLDPTDGEGNGRKPRESGNE